MKNVSHQTDSKTELPSQNRSVNITSAGACGDNSDTNQIAKKIDRNWTLRKGIQHRREEEEELAQIKLGSKQPYKSTNQDIFGAKLYGVYFTLMFLMGMCIVSVLYLCDNILLKYTVYMMAHTLTCFFFTFFCVLFQHRHCLLPILFIQLLTGYGIFHISQHSGYIPGMAWPEALPDALTVKVSSNHMTMLSSLTSTVESEVGLGNLGTTKTTETTTMPWTKPWTMSSTKEDTATYSISEQSQQSTAINALPEAGQTTDAGALTKSESVDNAKPVEMMLKAKPKAPTYTRHQEERKKRKIKRTLYNNRLPSQQAIEQAEAVKIELETRLKQVKHELNQLLNQREICKFE